MSLLEDIFLQDEANEAQQLERVIEGDEFDERLRSDNSNENSEKEDEAEEEKRRVDPTTTKTKRVVRNPRFILNPARLSGPRGIQVIPEHFKDFKFKGKGHEKEDLDLVLKKLEHWAYRLYPKFQFGDCLKKIETLGKKRPVMVHLHKIRSDQYVSEETVVQKDSSDDEETPAVPQEEDEFDRLLQQQIELARTPGPSSVRKPEKKIDNGIFNNPKATSSPSISEDQRERMLRSRRLAEEKRLARLKNITTNTSTENVSIENAYPVANEENGVFNNIVKEVGGTGKNKKNRSNIIDSSDEEDITVVETVTIDVHDCSNKNKRNSESMDSDTMFESNHIDAINKISTDDAVLSNFNNDKLNLDKDIINKSNNCSDDCNEDVNFIDFASNKTGNDSITCSKTEKNKVVENHDKQCNDNLRNDGIVICDLNSNNGTTENTKKTINKDTCIDTVSVEDAMNNKESESNINRNEIFNNDNCEEEASITESINVATHNLDKAAKEKIVTNIDDELMDVDFSDDF